MPQWVVLTWDATNIDAEPGFVDPAGPDGNPATWQGSDYHLSPGSPCIDAGENNRSGEDIDRQRGVIDGDSDGDPRVDIGCDEAAPLILVMPAALAPTTTSSRCPVNDAITVRNSGAGTLSYEASDDGEWLSVTPGTGASSGEGDLLIVEYATASLRPGTYAATITIRDSSSVSTPGVIPVTLTVLPVEGDFNADGDVDLGDFSGFQACFNGPNVPPGENCAVDADLDVDGDVDLQDFAAFQSCFNGPNRTPACE